jgi:hypothetical protein
MVGICGKDGYELCTEGRERNQLAGLDMPIDRRDHQQHRGEQVDDRIGCRVVGHQREAYAGTANSIAP